MFNFEPAYWLIVFAIGVCCLTAVVVVASSLMQADDENQFSIPRMGSDGTADEVHSS